MAKGEQKVYMPVVIGDWLKGTRGMKADVRGVYMGLLLHQWEKGFIPSDVYELEEIEREVNKVWDKLKHKFVEIEPGKLQNKKLEEIREFWQKQKKNGKKGGRPKNNNPEVNPNNNPETNPKHNHHNDLDIDNEDFKYKLREVEKTIDNLDEKLTYALDEIYIDKQRVLWQHVNFDFELNAFMEKVRGSPGHYENHDTGGIRLAFQSQLRNAKNKNSGTSKTTRAESVNSRREGFAKRHSSDAGS